MMIANATELLDEIGALLALDTDLKADGIMVTLWTNGEDDDELVVTINGRQFNVYVETVA